MLNREQVTEAIREWMEHIRSAEEQLEALGALAGQLDYDAPLPRAIMEMEGGYTRAVSREIGDKSGWLDYFRFACRFGADPKPAWPSEETKTGPGIQLDNPRQLARVICWDREHGEAAR